MFYSPLGCVPRGLYHVVMSLNEARRWHDLTPAERDAQVTMCAADSVYSAYLEGLATGLKMEAQAARERHHAARAVGGDRAMLEAATHLADCMEFEVAVTAIARIRFRAMGLELLGE